MTSFVPEIAPGSGKLDGCSAPGARSRGARRRRARPRDALAAPAPNRPERGARPRRPPPPGLAGRLGRPRADPPAASLLPGERLLAAEAQPGVLGRTRGVRARGRDRKRPSRGDRPLRPAVPVRLRARIPWRVPPCPRAWRGPRRRVRGGRGVRLRALAARAGRPPPRAVLGRDAARALPAGARLPAFKR